MGRRGRRHGPWSVAGALCGALLALAAEAVGSTGLLARRRGLLHRHAQSPIQMLDGEPCFEGRAMRNQLRSNARVKAEIVEVYSFVSETCNEGIHNIQCVAKAQFAEYPRDWLKLCEAKMGPQPTNAVAVCTYAQQVLDYVKPRATAYAELSDLLDAALPACQAGLPLPCIVQIEQCIGEPDMRYCFNQCLRSGTMAHALATKAKPCPTTPTTTPPAAGETTTTYWWQAIVEVVEGTVGQDLDGVKAEEFTTTTTTMALRQVHHDDDGVKSATRPTSSPPRGAVGQVLEADGVTPTTTTGAAPPPRGKMSYAAPAMMN
mmetsp:Transcript_121976/g.340050  ORF Transcript_121976/g.340050 Transcript_121976/m.340050 type:complete len:318 (+) Transcript_121976:39-992(+)